MNFKLLIQPSMPTLLRIFVILIYIITITATQGQVKGVLVLQEEGSLQKHIDASQRLLVLFSEEDCAYCRQFSSVFVLVQKLFDHNIRFIKINYSEQTKRDFEHYEILSMPTVLGFQKGKQLFCHYEPIQSGNTLSLYFFKWVERLYESLSEWAEEQQGANQLVVHCSNEQVKSFWEEVSQSQLWLDVHCGDQEYMHSNLAIVHEFGKKVEAWQLQNLQIEQIQRKIKKLITFYRFKHVVTWDSTIAHEIFVRNISAFVLLVNNESRSAQIYQYFEQLKKKWYEKSLLYEPVMFVVSDLSKNTYEAIKLKRYLTGSFTSSMRYTYYYPILAFISRFDNQGKFVMNITKQKTSENIGEFIENMRRYIINNETEPSDFNNSDIYVFFNEDREADLDDFTQKITELQKNQTKVEVEHEAVHYKIIEIETQQNWLFLLQKYQKPFFVYFTWRFDYKLQTLQNQLKKWWANKNNSEYDNQRKYSQIFVHALDEVDLPVDTQIDLEFVPTLIYFDREQGPTQRLEGVTDIEKIKLFVRNQLKDVIALRVSEEKGSGHRQQGRQVEKERDRELKQWGQSVMEKDGSEIQEAVQK